MAGICPYHVSTRLLTTTIAPMRKAQIPARAFQLLARHGREHGRKGSAPQAEDEFDISKLHAELERWKEQQAPPPRSKEEIQLLKDYMRHVTHPVTIITSTDTSISTSEPSKTWRGATVSSFNSVTLDPIPYVSFNITKHSSTYAAITSSKLFNVHLLSSSPEAIALATHFSQGNNAEPFLDHTSSPPAPHSWVRTATSWTSLVADPSALPPSIWWQYHGVPRAVIFQFLCEFQRHKVVTIGDHVIVVGKVIAQSGGLNQSKEHARFGVPVPSRCLVYAHGRYNEGNDEPSEHLKLNDRDGEQKVEYDTAETSEVLISDVEPLRKGLYARPLTIKKHAVKSKGWF